VPFILNRSEIVSLEEIETEISIKQDTGMTNERVRFVYPEVANTSKYQRELDWGFCPQYNRKIHYNKIQLLISIILTL
jgi:hypothetical protein